MVGVTNGTASGNTLPGVIGAWWSQARARFTRRCRLLGVESDGFGFRVVLLHAERGSVRVERVVEIAEVEPRAALAEMVATLRQADGELPKEAILLTPTAIAAVLELPVSPARPRLHDQMQGMIRWELEPFFVQRVGVWRLGQILVRRGYLTVHRIPEVIREAERRREETRRSLRDRSMSTLFGEVAVERGLVTADQRDEALAIQQQLQVTDDEMVCGWSAQRAPSAARSTTGPDKHPWLVCGLGRSERSRWVDLFQQHGITLLGIYPLVGCSAAALNGAVSPAAAVIEIRAGVMGCMRLSEGRVASLELFYAAGRASSDAASMALADQEGETLYLSGEDQRINSLSEALSFLGRQTARFIPVELEAVSLPSGVTPTALTGILGAVRNIWRLPGGGRAVCVPPRDPGPPLRQRVGVWWIAVGIAALALIGLVEMSTAIRIRAAGTRHAEALNAIASLKGEKTAIEERQVKLGELQDTVDGLKRRLAEVEARRAFLDIEIPGRSTRILSLLDVLGSALPRDMVLERLTEDDQGDVRLVGWGLSEQVLRDFADRLADAVIPLGLKMVELEAAPQPGRRGLSGYGLTVRLTPAGPPASSPAALGQTR